jgi:hypothetical protein
MLWHEGRRGISAVGVVTSTTGVSERQLVDDLVDRLLTDRPPA